MKTVDYDGARNSWIPRAGTAWSRNLRHILTCPFKILISWPNVPEGIPKPAKTALGVISEGRFT